MGCLNMGGGGYGGVMGSPNMGGLWDALICGGGVVGYLNVGGLWGALIWGGWIWGGYGVP